MCDVCSGFLNLVVSYESRFNGGNDSDQPVFLQKREIEIVLNYIQTWPNRQCMCCYRDAKNFDRFNLVVQGIVYFTVYQLKNIRKLLAQIQLQASACAGSGPTQEGSAGRDDGSTGDIKPADEEGASVKAAECKELARKDATDRKTPDRKEDRSKDATTASREEKSDLPSNRPLSRKGEEGSDGEQQPQTCQSAGSQSSSPLGGDVWTLLDVEKLLILVSKVFLLNFPLYVAYKHGVHARMDEVSPHEVQSLSQFCDLHDSEIPAFLLRNVSLFCNYAGFEAMMQCFDQPGLPVSTAHAITATSSNIKLWINYRSIVQLFIPLRVKVLQYMCRLSDQDLRSPATKSMADFMWTAIKDPLDSQITFDTEGLALAFKYFTSSTLTMRLAGMAQINAHINMFNDICTSETVSEVEAVGVKLACWLTENQIISHLFGPNLHVEVIKQSHIVLNFLAVENQISEDHITLMWQAAQLKHCSKTVYDILPSLVKNLAPKPATHLYALLCRLDPREHTEQSIYIASALTKLIWMRDCSRQTLFDMSKAAAAAAAVAAAGSAIGEIAAGRAAGDYNELPSSSENSVSVDGSNSEDEHPEDDSSDGEGPSAATLAPVGAGGHKPPTLGPMGAERGGESDTGAPPCKQARHKNCCDETTDDSIKAEADIYNVHQRMKDKIRIPLITHSMAAFNEDGTSSDECIDVDESFIMRKKLRKKRRKISGLTRKELQELQESVSDVEDSDLLAAMMPDSDCSDNNLQTSVLRHLQQQHHHHLHHHQQHHHHQQQQQHHHHHHQHPQHHHGGVVPPGVLGSVGVLGAVAMGERERGANSTGMSDDVSSFMGAMGEGHLINFLNAAAAADQDNSCSSPLSNKSEKNLADFDDEPSPCEEELAELAARGVSLHQSFPIPRSRSIGTVPGGPSALRPGVAPPGMGMMKQHSSPHHPSHHHPHHQHHHHHHHHHHAAAAAAGLGHRIGTPNNNGAGASGAKMGKGPSTKTRDILQATAAAAASAGPVGSSLIVAGGAYRFADVCLPGNTLLWDLLQDDKIGQLGESIALEAEKVLGTLLCYHTDKNIRTRFIEGCLHNLAENRSIVTSLKLLPKLFASFQQFRDVTTHQVVLWAERQHEMMFHFFNNLKHYASRVRSGNAPPLYAHVTQIQVRLQFLTSVFSDVGSPRSFRLTLNQVGALWDCLANDPECSDCLFSWLQAQVKGGDTHALGVNAIQHLYLKRLPELKPEGISTVALGLFQQLFTLGRGEMFYHSNAADGVNHQMDTAAIEQLWKIALRATNTDVSLSAIQYINTYYMEQQLRYEHQFVAQCMNHLSQAVEELNQQRADGPATEYALMCVQRALMLLNTHLDTFRRRYAYHLRRWALEGTDIGAHSALRAEGPGPPIRIVLQPAGVPDKSFLSLHASDLVADLKAEIAKWWETYQGGSASAAAQQTKGPAGSGGSETPINNAGETPPAPVLGLLLNDGPLRIITQGQEITSEYDERSLADVGFKDNQMVYVSLGGRSMRRREQAENPSMQPPPPKEWLPTLLLLKPPYFEQLFRLMQTLGDMKISTIGERCQPNTKAQLLSRRVWDILAMLPTCPSFLNTLKNLTFKEDKLEKVEQSAAEEREQDSKQHANGDSVGGAMMVEAMDETITTRTTATSTPTDHHSLLGGCYTLEEILDPRNLQKFMYALHIVESLCKSKFVGNCCGAGGGAAVVGGGAKPFIDTGGHGRIGGPSTSSKILSVKNQLKLKISSSKSLKMQNQACATGNAAKQAGVPSSTITSSSCSSSSSSQESPLGNSASGRRAGGGSPSKTKRSEFTSPGSVLKPTPLAAMEDEERPEPGGAGSSANKENNKPAPHGTDGEGAVGPTECGSNVTSPGSVQSSIVSTVEDSSNNKLLVPVAESNREQPVAIASSTANSDRPAPSHSEDRPTSKVVVEWSNEFIRCGGLAHLYRIFLSGALQKSTDGSDENVLNEWRHDCLASLLRIFCLLGMDELKAEAEGNGVMIPPLNRETLALLEPRPTLERIASILNEESLPLNPNLFKTGLFGRPQVIHYAMNVLVCYAHSCREVRRMLWTIDDNAHWLQRLILDDPEPAVRREACAALYRLCLGNAQTYYELMAPLLSKLVALLPLAENMKPQALAGVGVGGVGGPGGPGGGSIYGALLAAGDEGKEPYGPACRDYFWLLCRLVDALSPELLRGGGGGGNGSIDAELAPVAPPTPTSSQSRDTIGLDAMCQQVARSILERDYLESRHGAPDDGLFGLLNLMANLLKFDPPFKYSTAGQEFMVSVFCCLFELPSPEDREKPKCKSHGARAAAYDLLVEMCRNAPENYLLLHGKLMQQHRSGPHSPYPWDYWPQDEGRSECGYVGLTNLGATCYMASCIQHLFMTPQTRDAILSISTDAPQKHKATLYELQRMFAYLMESERKAYCPRSFCRVYQMDHQPLNTGEQKDMAEFFIDLVSKLEEMTPELKALVKRIFCGVISNNVVSLDCGHVSRTLEEFYTVRCQVADMRNLHESLDEVTVKDTLEGDNMYTCSQCGKKVRAEKRACFKKLPQILCFNTMRYTFNMVTMLKEKVNTHFSFPMRLDMSGYVEKTLMPHHYQEEKRKSQMRRSHSRNVSESSTSEVVGGGVLSGSNPAPGSSTIATSGGNDDNSSSSSTSSSNNSTGSTSTGSVSTSSDANVGEASNSKGGSVKDSSTYGLSDKAEAGEDVEMKSVVAGCDMSDGIKSSSTVNKTDEAVTNGNTSDGGNGELQKQQQTMDEEESEDFNEHYEYDLVGVTVHTGNADGGHYYSFIKERNEDGDPNHQERWFLFNDAEVKLFDPSQIAAECFGGEMTSKTYDSVTEKYLDFSFEKTNSAYMLFYEWRSNKGKNVQRDQVDQQAASASGEKRNNSTTSSVNQLTEKQPKSPLTFGAAAAAAARSTGSGLSPTKKLVKRSEPSASELNSRPTEGGGVRGALVKLDTEKVSPSTKLLATAAAASSSGGRSALNNAQNSLSSAVTKSDSSVATLAAQNNSSTRTSSPLASPAGPDTSLAAAVKPSTKLAASTDSSEEKKAKNERDQETEQFIQQQPSEVAKQSNNLSKCDIDNKREDTARPPAAASSTLPSTALSQGQQQTGSGLASASVAATATSASPTIVSLANKATLSATTSGATSSIGVSSIVSPVVTTLSKTLIATAGPSSMHPIVVPLVGTSMPSSSSSTCIGVVPLGVTGVGTGSSGVLGFPSTASISGSAGRTMLHEVVQPDPSPSTYSSISSLSALTATVGGNIGLPTMAAVVGQPTAGVPGPSLHNSPHVVLPSSSSSPGCSSSSSGGGGGPVGSGSGLVMVNRISTSNKRLRRRPLSKELEEWIWQDNRHFLQDRNIFEHTYFNFMWQVCGHIPQSLLALPDITCIAAQLSVSFFIETFIHAKEKPTMVLWVELLTKQFNASQEACEWFLSHMSAEPWWPVQVLIQCPNQMVRQMFQRLVIHVIQRLRQSHCALYLKAETDVDGNEIIGNVSCVTRFIKSLIMLMEHGAKAHSRHLSEFFGLLYEFSRMGEEEALFLLRINVIRSVADFYLGHKGQECIDASSDNDENSSDETLTVDKSRPASLDKMIALVASLVERSRGPDLRLHLSARDYNAIAGGKGFPFLYQQIKDNINPHQTRHLIHALCRCDERLASQIITMLFTAVTKHTELCGPFFKLLTLLTESSGGPSGLPCFSQLVLQRVWDAAEYCPQSALDWLAVQAPRNKIAHNWILQSAESWVETFLLAHSNARVRNAAAYLLVSLVPSQSFRNNYRPTSHHKMSMHVFQHREISCEAQLILHTILNLLLLLLRSARNYTEFNVHGTTKLTAYFNLLTYCLVSKTEKLMVGPHLRSLWELFHPRLSEPAVPAHHNKQALLAFWYQATLDCPENAILVANCPDITRNIAFNYILADHDDTEIVTYNRAMLPVYYGLLRMCCQQSRLLTRQLAAHQNLQWAFKNITPHPTQYPLAVDELFRLMTLFAQRHPDANEVEQRDVTIFRRTTLTAYLNGLDARVSWGTLIAALRILVENDDDRLFVVLNGGIALCFEALHTLHSMYHEATACHVFGDLQELLTEVILLISTLRVSCREQKKRPPPPLMKGLPEAVRRLATLLNTFNPPEMRNLALEVLKELVKCATPDIISTVLVPLLTNCHAPNVHHLTHHQSNLAASAGGTTGTALLSSGSSSGTAAPGLAPTGATTSGTTTNPSANIGPLGSYFPRRGVKAAWPPVSKNTPRPPRPMVQMNIPQSQICEKGLDKDFDLALELFYRPYHEFLDIMFRVAVTANHFTEPMVHLSLLAGIEAVVLHFNIFAKFWVGIYNNKTTHRYSEMLIKNPLLIDYIDNILRDERLSLNDPIIANFIEIYYPKIKSRLVVPRLLESICQLLPDKGNLEDICGDLQAIRIIGQRTGIPSSVKAALQNSLHAVLTRFKDEIYSDEETPPKKRKVTVPHITIHPIVRSPAGGGGTLVDGAGVAATGSGTTASSASSSGGMKSSRGKETIPSIEITVKSKQQPTGSTADTMKPPSTVGTAAMTTTSTTTATKTTATTTTMTLVGIPRSAPEAKRSDEMDESGDSAESPEGAKERHKNADQKKSEVTASAGSGSNSTQPPPVGSKESADSSAVGPAVPPAAGSDEPQSQQQQKQQEQYLRSLMKDIESHIELIFECLDDDEDGDDDGVGHDKGDTRTRRSSDDKGTPAGSSRQQQQQQPPSNKQAITARSAQHRTRADEDGDDNNSNNDNSDDDCSAGKNKQKERVTTAVPPSDDEPTSHETVDDAVRHKLTQQTVAQLVAEADGGRECPSPSKIKKKAASVERAELPPKPQKATGAPGFIEGGIDVSEGGSEGEP